MAIKFADSKNAPHLELEHSVVKSLATGVKALPQGFVSPAESACVSLHDFLHSLHILFILHEIDPFYIFVEK